MKHIYIPYGNNGWHFSTVKLRLLLDVRLVELHICAITEMLLNPSLYWNINVVLVLNIEV
jgi:hypothetical protein